VGKKGLVNILRGSLVASIGADRCRQHGALAGLSRARIERLAEALVERGYLERDTSGEWPLFRVTPAGRQAAAAEALPEEIDV
jgi:DNA-binding IclR family transcriptional regulator